MSIKCCKSYVGKEIIGLLPGAGSTPVSPKCLYYAETSNISSGWNGFNLDIDGTYFPSCSFAYEIGTSIQTAYNAESGGYGVAGLGQNIKLWSLESDPITTTWQILNFDDFNFYQVDMFPLSCDLTTNCYQVDINQSGAAILDLVLAGNYFGSIVDTWSTNSIGMTTSDPQFVTLLQSIFGGQAIITVNDNGTSTFIQIDNCYEAIHPKTITLQGGTGTTSYNFQTCTP